MTPPMTIISIRISSLAELVAESAFLAEGAFAPHNHREGRPGPSVDSKHAVHFASHTKRLARTNCYLCAPFSTRIVSENKPWGLCSVCAD